MSNRLSRVLVIAASAVFLAVFVAFLIFRWVVPFDGAIAAGGTLQLSSGMPVQIMQRYPGGLREGDIVTAVDGVSLETWGGDILARELPRPRWEIGGTADYTILRDGQELQFSQPLGRYPLGEVLLDNWGAWVFAVGNLLVALFAFSRKPDEPALCVYLLVQP